MHEKGLYDPSNRVLSIEECATADMASKTRKLKEEGTSIITLSRDESNFATPTHICHAAIMAIQSGLFSAVPPTAGYPDLRDAIAAMYRNEKKVDCYVENVVISNGHKQAISTAMMALLNPGDEVIIFSPRCSSYYNQVKLCDAVPVIVKGDASEGYKVRPEQLQEAITHRTRLIVIASPSNPTGLVYTRQELNLLSDILLKHPGIFVLSDEIYDHIDFDCKATSFASLPGMLERTITVNGFGKSYAMTGWRVGYLIASDWIANACIKLQENSASASSISQRAALAALRGGLAVTMDMVAAYKRRRNLLLERLKAVPDFQANRPQGTFYLFPDVSQCYRKTFRRTRIEGSDALCAYLLEHAGVSMVPGSAFGEDRCVRISFAVSEKELFTSVDRVAEAISRLT